MKIHALPFFSLILFSFAFIASTAVIDPTSLRSSMFTTEITGIPYVLIPTQTYETSEGRLYMEKYTITMEKSFLQMLPKDFPKTPAYAYSGQTKTGKVTSFPGPSIIAKKDIPVKVVWVNNITGKHFLPVDYSEPFINSSAFLNEVPVVPHAHGLVTQSISDGQPSAYWTASGSRSQDYNTQESCQKNEAVYIYPNDQDPGLYWYHDHTYGITRLNVLAGLVGYYQIAETQETFSEKRMKQNYGDVEKKYFAIADRSFTTDGELYYPDEAFSKDYTSWNPQVFGNMILVNGKVWPKINLQRKKYRLLFLNACQCRYLNFYFMVAGRKIPFQLIRMQGDYLPQPVVTTEYFLSLGARIQIVLDLSSVSGQVIMKNNAPAPHPDGDQDNLIDEFTGTIMKISINVAEEKLTFLNLLNRNKVNKRRLPLKYNTQYPAFEEGQHVYTTLIELVDDDLESMGMFIDGVSMKLGKNCEGSTYQIGKVYDFYIINLTPDTHPIHFHLINMQKIKQYKIKANLYETDWYALNGGRPGRGGFQKIPLSLDPLFYQDGPIIEPKPYEKLFRDVLDVFPHSVTVMRIKFSHNDGRPFSFDATKGRYVYHCHMLQHQDNEMMRYFCLK